MLNRNRDRWVFTLKTPDTGLSFVTQDYTYSVAKSIGLLLKISKLKLFTSVMDALTVLGI